MLVVMGATAWVQASDLAEPPQEDLVAEVGAVLDQVRTDRFLDLEPRALQEQ